MARTVRPPLPDPSPRPRHEGSGADGHARHHAGTGEDALTDTAANIPAAGELPPDTATDRPAEPPLRPAPPSPPAAGLFAQAAMAPPAGAPPAPAPAPAGEPNHALEIYFRRRRPGHIPLPPLDRAGLFVDQRV